MSWSLTTNRSHTAGHFELQIDGHRTSAYLKSVDGGSIKASLVDEPIGPENLRIKHVSTVDVDPISLEVGLSGTNEILTWIQGTWKKRHSRRNGQIIHGDFNKTGTYVHEFTEALITETTFPTLDGASKEAAFLKVKIQPETVKLEKVAGNPPLRAEASPKQKLWAASGFRLNLDGVDGIQHVNKIESFTIKQGIKKLYTGESRFPEIEPTKIEFPSLSATISLAHADALLKWHDEYVRTGRADPQAQKSGALEFLSPNRADTLFRINLFEVGIHSAAIQQSTANSDQIKRVKFELYVGRMELDTGATGFA